MSAEISARRSPTGIPPRDRSNDIAPNDTAPTEAPGPSGHDRFGTIRMLLVVAGMFMITVDFFVVNVAIPSIHTDLHAGSAAVEFVVSGFSLAYAAGMLTAGRLGDLYGRRRLFMTGMALFTLASLGAGLASGPDTLVAARVAQGVSAAVMTPQMPAILTTSFRGVLQVRAFTAFALSMGVGATFGQLLGGLLVHLDIAGLGWRTIFLINVPIGLVVLPATRMLVPESRGGGRRGLDLTGAALGACGLLAVVLPLVVGRQQGWPGWSWACLAGAVPLSAGFVLRQRRLERTGRAPLIAPSLFRERAFSIGVLAVLGFFAAMASFMLVLALYLQEGRGLSPLGAGEVFGALGVGYVPAALAAPRLAARLGRRVLTLGALGVGAGYALLVGTVSSIGVTGPAPLMSVGLLVAGAGMALFANPVTPMVLAGVSARHAAAAAGVLSTAQEGGNALGVAGVGVVFFGVLGDGHAGGYAHAFAWSVGALALLTVAVAGLVEALPRGGGAR